MNRPVLKKYDMRKDLILFVVLMAVALLMACVNWSQPRTAMTVPLFLMEGIFIFYYFWHLASGQRAILWVLVLTVVLAVSVMFWPGWDHSYSARSIPVVP